MGIIGLTLVLVGVVAFLIHTSQNTHWGGGFWEAWLMRHFSLQPSTAHQMVFWVRKSIHFSGYGILALLFWLYFFLWRLRGAAVWGVVGAGTVAAFDEYIQSRSGFRSGQPQDVLLDICGGIVFAVLAAVYLRRRFPKGQSSNGTEGT